MQKSETPSVTGEERQVCQNYHSLTKTKEILQLICNQNTQEANKVVSNLRIRLLNEMTFSQFFKESWKTAFLVFSLQYQNKWTHNYM